jgi:hypothetical protein
MAAVITSDSTVQCQHQGTVTPIEAAVAEVLLVAGAAVLVDTLVGSTVGTDCTQQPPPNSNTPCKALTKQSTGQSTVLFVGTRPVLLDTAAGETNGQPTKVWSVVDAAQNVLTAD